MIFKTVNTIHRYRNGSNCKIVKQLVQDDLYSRDTIFEIEFEDGIKIHAFMGELLPQPIEYQCADPECEHSWYASEPPDKCARCDL